MSEKSGRVIIGGTCPLGVFEYGERNAIHNFKPFSQLSGYGCSTSVSLLALGAERKIRSYRQLFLFLFNKKNDFFIFFVIYKADFNCVQFVFQSQIFIIYC